MASTKISDMTAATDLVGAVVPIVQSGVNKKADSTLFGVPPPLANIGLWEIDTGSTSPPNSAGQLRYDNATQTSATELYIHETTDEGHDALGLLGLVTNGYIKVQDKNDEANYQLWLISGTPSIASNTYTFPVTLEDSGGTGTTGFGDALEVRVGVLTEGGGSVVVSSEYADTATMIADQGSQVTGAWYRATDASDDPTVDVGWAIYEYLGTTNGDLTDYTKIQEEESVEGTSDIGDHDIFIPASAMWPRITSGCSALTKREVATSLANIQTLRFDATTQEFAQFQTSFPRNWNNGTITATVYWTTVGGSSSETVQWGISAGAFSNDDALSTALGTAQTVSDTWIADNDVHITSMTSAITIAGSPADSDFIVIQISRNPSADDLAVDAELLGVRITITTDASVAA